MNEVQPVKHRLLVVDDREYWLELTKKILAGSEYIIDLASNISDFYLHLGKYPDLIILNHEFHTLDEGRTLLQALRVPQYSNIPVIVFTGFAANATNIPRVYPHVTDVVIKGKEESGQESEFTKALLEAVDRQLSPRISWLHLSDLHIGSEDSNHDWQYLSEALLQDLAEHSNIQKVRENPRLAGVPFRPNFLFITGDVVWKGKKTEYAKAESFLKKIWDATGLSPENTFFVPGNHDISRTTCEKDKVFLAAYNESIALKDDTPKWDRNTRQWWIDARFQKILHKKHREYLNFIKQCSSAALGEKLFYIEKKQVGTVTVEVIGINSALMCHKDGEDLERGLWIGMPQIEDLHNHMNNNGTTQPNTCRIFLVHHPREALHYCDEATWSFMQKNGSILLHGHLHKADISAVLRPGHKHICVPGGSVHQGGKWVSQRYNYVEYNHQAKILRAYFRKTTQGDSPQYIRDNESFPDEAPEGHITIQYV